MPAHMRRSTRGRMPTPLSSTSSVPASRATPLPTGPPSAVPRTRRSLDTWLSRTRPTELAPPPCETSRPLPSPTATRWTSATCSVASTWPGTPRTRGLPTSEAGLATSPTSSGSYPRPASSRARSTRWPTSSARIAPGISSTRSTPAPTPLAAPTCTATLIRSIF